MWIDLSGLQFEQHSSFSASQWRPFYWRNQSFPSRPYTAQDSADAWCIHFMPQQQKSTLYYPEGSYGYEQLFLINISISFCNSVVKMHWNVLKRVYWWVMRKLSIDHYMHSQLWLLSRITMQFHHTEPLLSITGDMWPITPHQCENPDIHQGGCENVTSAWENNLHCQETSFSEATWQPCWHA